jgi:hypothetical protein
MEGNSKPVEVVSRDEHSEQSLANLPPREEPLNNLSLGLFDRLPREMTCAIRRRATTAISTSSEQSISASTRFCPSCV